MRQVPQYLIIGNGRCAKHISYYFSSLSVSFSTWHRSQSLDDLYFLSHQATHILVLIADDAMMTFANKYLKHSSAYKIHFSGALQINNMIGAHPLMTFANYLYSAAIYPTIPFIIDENSPSFSLLFPALPNPHFRLPSQHKAKYHALCVMAGNFTCLLWQKLFDEFEKKFGMQKEMAHPFLQQQMNNLMINAEAALTGPLTRNDQETIQKNITALSGDSFQAIYNSFVEMFNHVRNKK